MNADRRNVVSLKCNELHRPECRGLAAKEYPPEGPPGILLPCGAGGATKICALSLPLQSLYNRQSEALPDTNSKPRRWTVIASGLLCGVLALVVIFTKPAVFFSPLALVVVAAIGSAAVLLQLRIRNREQGGAGVHPPVWLNFVGILLALAALFPDVLHLSVDAAKTLALGAVCAFGISGAIVLHAFRKRRTSKQV